MNHHFMESTPLLQPKCVPIPEEDVTEQRSHLDRSWLGLTKEEVLVAGNCSIWQHARQFLFMVFWVFMCAMLIIVILIIILTPKCYTTNEQLMDVINVTSITSQFTNST